MRTHLSCEPVDGVDEGSERDPVVRGQIRPQIVRAAAPLVDGATPVSTRVMKTARGDLDQAFVETRVRAASVGRPFLFPDLVRIPVKAAVEKLDAPQ